jgi:hypothetical protein
MRGTQKTENNPINRWAIVANPGTRGKCFSGSDFIVSQDGLGAKQKLPGLRTLSSAPAQARETYQSYSNSRVTQPAFERGDYRIERLFREERELCRDVQTRGYKTVTLR